ncbi:MAG: IclR family transcriptional regulator C-terminal domain-containing protein, partial [Mycobacterium sp.]
IVAFAGRRGRRDGHAPAIDTARRRGYALSDPADVTAIAVPVFDVGGRVRASVSVQALSVRLNPSLISQIYPVMRSTAAMLSDSVTEASQRMDPAALLRSTI